MEENKNIKKNQIIKVVALLGVFLIVFGASYALFSVVLTGTKKNKISTASFGLTLTDTEGNVETEGYSISLENAVPISDEDGLSLEPYKFVVTNTGTIPASYTLTIEDIEGVVNTLDDEYIKYNIITKDYLSGYVKDAYPQGYHSTQYYGHTVFSPPLLSDTNRILDKTTLLPGESIEYSLNIWVDYDATIEQAGNKSFEGSIKVDGIQPTIHTQGVFGDDIEYNYYSDGTLILIGKGAMKGVETENGDATAINNNINPSVDVVYNYLLDNGMEAPEVIEQPEGYVALGDMISDKKMGINQYGEYYYTLENITTCSTNDSNSMCESIMPILGMFNNDPELTYQALTLVNELPKINRIVIDEGITTVSSLFAIQTPYMVSLPTTLQRIEEHAFGWIYDATLNIPNSVVYVGDEAINTSGKTTVINIDNTEEFVTTNWVKNWSGNEPTVNYLR